MGSDGSRDSEIRAISAISDKEINNDAKKSLRFCGSIIKLKKRRSFTRPFSKIRKLEEFFAAAKNWPNPAMQTQTGDYR
jgi:hypothetical protein